MLRVALREGFQVAVSSFDDLIVRTERGGREIMEEEQENLLPIFDPWMRRLWEFAKEACLSQGDLLCLTDAMIDEHQGASSPKAAGRRPASSRSRR